MNKRKSDSTPCDLLSTRGPTLRLRLQRLRTVVKGQWRTPKIASRTWKKLSREPSRTWPARCANTKSWWTSNWPWTLRLPPTGNCWKERKSGRINLNIFLIFKAVLQHQFKNFILTVLPSDWPAVARTPPSTCSKAAVSSYSAAGSLPLKPNRQITSLFLCCRKAAVQQRIWHLQFSQQLWSWSIYLQDYSVISNQEVVLKKEVLPFWPIGNSTVLAKLLSVMQYYSWLIWLPKLSFWRWLQIHQGQDYEQGQHGFLSFCTKANRIAKALKWSN